MSDLLLRQEEGHARTDWRCARPECVCPWYYAPDYRRAKEQALQHVHEDRRGA